MKCELMPVAVEVNDIATAGLSASNSCSFANYCKKFAITSTPKKTDWAPKTDGLTGKTTKY